MNLILFRSKANLEMIGFITQRESANYKRTNNLKSITDGLKREITNTGNH